MSLSVCLMTDAPEAQVAAVLAPLRPLADEIVLALDAKRIDVQAAGGYLELADTVVAAAFPPPPEYALAWLHEHCTRDWILRIDSDEVPSAALVRALPGVLSDPLVTHAWIARRWLYGEPGQVLDQRPWWPDFQLRLIRNDGGFRRFPGEMHSSVEVPGPRRLLAEPLYHADLLVQDASRRRAKALRYERERPGVRVAGLPQNLAHYVPELQAGLALASVAPEDERAVAALLAGTASAPQRRAGSVAVTSLDAVAAAWERGARGPRRRVGEVELLARDRTLVAGELTPLLVALRNLGDDRWAAAPLGEARTVLSYQWLDAAGEVVIEGQRQPLPGDLAPGERCAAALHVEAPSEPGHFALRVGLMQEHEYWFHHTEPVGFTITPRCRIAVAGRDAALVEAHLEELAREQPELEGQSLAPGADARRALRGYEGVLIAGRDVRARLAARVAGVPCVVSRDPAAGVAALARRLSGR